MTHDSLWAPWRLNYIKNDSSKEPSKPKNDCFLCEYRDAALSEDASNFVVQRGKRTLTVLNRYPYNNGHLLIAPLKHIATLEELDDATLLETMQVFKQMTKALTQTLNAQGYNIGLNLGEVAGAGLPGHLHWHIVPRWSGDNNFMPVVAETNVIPQSLTALYELLCENK